MGGQNSGRRSIKLQAIECIMEVQSMLVNLLYNDIDSNMTRDDLQAKVEDVYKKTKVVQEEIERIKVK